MVADPSPVNAKIVRRRLSIVASPAEERELESLGVGGRQADPPTKPPRAFISQVYVYVSAAMLREMEGQGEISTVIRFFATGGRSLGRSFWNTERWARRFDEQRSQSSCQHIDVSEVRPLR